MQEASPAASAAPSAATATQVELLPNGGEAPLPSRSVAIPKQNGTDANGTGVDTSAGGVGVKATSPLAALLTRAANWNDGKGNGEGSVLPHTSLAPLSVEDEPGSKQLAGTLAALAAELRETQRWLEDGLVDATEHSVQVRGAPAPAREGHGRPLFASGHAPSPPGRCSSSSRRSCRRRPIAPTWRPCSPR